MALDKKRKSVEMRIRNVPVAIHKAVKAHQGLMAQKSKDQISIDQAAIDLMSKGIQTIPALNQ